MSGAECGDPAGQCECGCIAIAPLDQYDMLPATVGKTSRQSHRRALRDRTSKRECVELGLRNLVGDVDCQSGRPRCQTIVRHKDRDDIRARRRVAMLQIKGP